MVQPLAITIFLQQALPTVPPPTPVTAKSGHLLPIQTAIPFITTSLTSVQMPPLPPLPVVKLGTMKTVPTVPPVTGIFLTPSVPIVRQPLQALVRITPTKRELTVTPTIMVFQA